MMICKNNLAKVRVHSGVSQRTLSSLSGVAHTTIVLIEKGKSANPRATTRYKLAKALLCSENDIFPADAIYITKKELVKAVSKRFVNGVLTISALMEVIDALYN